MKWESHEDEWLRIGASIQPLRDHWTPQWRRQRPFSLWASTDRDEWGLKMIWLYKNRNAVDVRVRLHLQGLLFGPVTLHKNHCYNQGKGIFYGGSPILPAAAHEYRGHIQSGSLGNTSSGERFPFDSLQLIHSSLTLVATSVMVSKKPSIHGNPEASPNPSGLNDSPARRGRLHRFIK